MKVIPFSIAALAIIVVGCGTPLPTAAPTTVVELGQATLAASNGYRPLQKNDHIEGTQIDLADNAEDLQYFLARGFTIHDLLKGGG